jgi:hypothetical protein
VYILERGLATNTEYIILPMIVKDGYLEWSLFSFMFHFAILSSWEIENGYRPLVHFVGDIFGSSKS